jgi:hypothetical protein
MSYRQTNRMSEPELRAHAAARGYQPGWVWHRLRDRVATA